MGAVGLKCYTHNIYEYVRRAVIKEIFNIFRNNDACKNLNRVKYDELKNREGGGKKRVEKSKIMCD